LEEVSEDKRRIEVNWVQSAAGALAAVTSAVLLSTVGVVLTANFEWTPRGFAAKRGLPVLGSQDNVPEALLSMQNTSKAFTIVSRRLPTVSAVHDREAGPAVIA
jgi:hypothetical protein